MKIKYSKLIILAGVICLSAIPVPQANSSVTINYEIGEITSGGTVIPSGTFLFISHGTNNVFNSNSWANGSSNFLVGDDTLIKAVEIVSGVSAGAISTFSLPSNQSYGTTQFTGLFLAGLSSSDIDYSNGSLLNGKIFGSGGSSYSWGSYRTDSISNFGSVTGRIAWVVPSDGATVDLSAYSNTGDYTGASVTANLATSAQIGIVPEPSTGALMMIGAVGLVALRRLRKV